MRQKRLRWFRHVVRTEEEVEIMKVLGVKNRRTKTGRPMKRWIGAIEEDTKKRRVL